MTGRLGGVVAIVTGGGSGIGRASAIRFAQEGARAIVLVDRDDAGIEATSDAVTAAGAEATGVTTDVTDERTAAATVEQVVGRFGRIDVLMTAAGISVGRSLVDTTPDEWERVFATNVTGTYLWMRAVLPSMIERGHGSIVTVASQLAVNGGRGNAAYIASKGAIVALTRTTALDVAGTGVRVNSLLPGATETPLLERSFSRNADPDGARARSVARHPMGRFATADEVALAALYLASDESSFTTGTELRVDGGWIAG